MENLHKQYRANLIQFPAMLDQLSALLGVTAQTLNDLEVGYAPKRNSWTFPERNIQGEVIGILHRYPSGDKRIESGGKRGLIFSPSALLTEKKRQADYRKLGREYKSLSIYQYLDDSEDICPVCGKQGWCMVYWGNDDAELLNPRAVVCNRTPDSPLCISTSGGNNIHIRRPVVLTEGASDTAAAMDMGFVAVGRSSASAGQRELTSLLKGLMGVLIVADNDDSGVGQASAEALATSLKVVCECVKVVTPPAKDLRNWYADGAKDTDVLELVTKQREGESKTSPKKNGKVAPAKKKGVVESKVLPPRSNYAQMCQRWFTDTFVKDRLPILCRYQKAWYIYRNGFYEQFDQDDMYRSLQHYFKGKMCFDETKGLVPPPSSSRAYSDIGVNLLGYAPTVPDSRPIPAWIGAPRSARASDLIVMKNGILDIERYHKYGPDKVMLRQTPALFSLFGTDYNFDPEAKCPRWLSFIHEVFEEPAQRLLLQEWMGLNLIPDTSYEKFMIMVGEPGAGKGTIADVMKALIGCNFVATPALTDFSPKNSFGLAQLCGKLSIIIDEAQTQFNDPAMDSVSQTLLTVIGRGAVAINQKYERIQTNVHLPGRITVLNNRLPVFRDNAGAFDRRALFLYFDRSFKDNPDITLKSTLVKETPGIFLWALEGLLRLREQSTFTEPATSKRVREMYKAECNAVESFIESCCEVGPELQEKKSIITTCWSYWHNEQYDALGKKNEIRQYLDNRFGRPVRPRNANGRAECYIGIKVTEDALFEYGDKI